MSEKTPKFVNLHSTPVLITDANRRRVYVIPYSQRDRDPTATSVLEGEFYRRYTNMGGPLSEFRPEIPKAGSVAEKAVETAVRNRILSASDAHPVPPEGDSVPEDLVTKAKELLEDAKLPIDADNVAQVIRHLRDPSVQLPPALAAISAKGEEVAVEETTTEHPALTPDTVTALQAWDKTVKTEWTEAQREAILDYIVTRRKLGNKALIPKFLRSHKNDVDKIADEAK